MIETKFKTFFTDVDNMCQDLGMDYIDAVIHWCEKHEFEVESVASAIKANSVLMSKLQIEAENLNFLKKTGARLPV